MLFLKRLMDITVAGLGLLLLSPVLAIIALIIRVSMGPPVLFRHTRPGYQARPFELLKFRTMNDLRDAQGTLLPDTQRSTPFGQFLRNSSLDELPQLWNVLQGEMSLVGPRPLLMQYLPRYTAEQARRHQVKPGITGWAQVNGRNAVTWEQRFALDLWYVDHWNLTLDLRILFKTVVQVFRREGINPAREATMPEFMGSTNENSKVPLA